TAERMLNYYRPKSVTQALSILNDSSETAVPYAGATDLIPRYSKGTAKRPAVMVDLKTIEELHGVSEDAGEIRIGACTLMSELASDPVLLKKATILAEAAGRIACPQVRNRATIGGNLCNASPAADTAVPLIVLDAELELHSLDSQNTKSAQGTTRRRIHVTDFFKGPGATRLAPGEIVVAIRFKPLPPGVYAAWDKFGTRPSMEIAVASVGVALLMEKGKVTRARIGYGSVAPTPLRGRKAEAALFNEVFTQEVIDRCVAAAREEISPISDLRATENYRREITGVMLARLLEGAQHA
ncbi:MAG: xanthine dehydrogenase family protein subunit M, partial [Planctomycetota bacterium]